QGIPGTGLSLAAGSGAEVVALVAWLSLFVGLVQLRRAGRSAPVWVAPVFGLLALTHLVRVVTPFNDGAIVASNAIAVLALSLCLAGSLSAVRASLRSQDAHAHRLRLRLDELHQHTISEQAALEERLHDLRNAVAAMRSADNTLRRYAGRLDESARVSLADALSSELGRLQALIEPTRQSVTKDFPLADVVEPVAALARSLGADIRLELNEQSVNGDECALAQVVQNIFVNARHYAKGSPVRVVADRSGDRVRVRIEDEGPGIDPVDRLAVFERGTRGTVDSVTGGRGLGLFVAARLMTEMGGSLTLADHEGEGAHFVLELLAPEVAGSEVLPSALGEPFLRSVS
ncbi:MAG: sensor histidine kinase, partial [Acidimicrobiales bacterium]